ncbi:hypothetical protein [Marinagarivorans algicola]|uniref:hypothetical protein n=1 Tax=Marinagarivorans algicola TaxID=1513270 RepID=UPI0006B9724E|nr:hypothetical protein [Marinagarivorans algicola]
MKHLKYLSVLTVVGFLSSSAFAEPAVLESQLKLIGFAGGSCTVNVNATANATSLDLNNPNLNLVDVATVNTACDYDYRLTVTADTDEGGLFALKHHELEDVYTHYALSVDGIKRASDIDPSEIGLFPAGENRQMSVQVETFGSAPSPGIYQGSVTFSLIVD